MILSISKQKMRAFGLSLILGLSSVFTAFAQPANDNPCSATALTPTSSCSYVSATTAGATSTAGVPAPGCASYSGSDVWFSIVVPAGGILTIDSNTGSITDGGMAAYTGTCGALTLLSCNDDGSANGLMPMLSLSGLTVGSTIYIRFWQYGGGTGTFSICATAPEPAPPCGSSPAAGNSCATATPICDLNGYCGNTSASYTANTWSQSCGFLGLSNCGLTGVFCGSIENNSFLSFTASSTTISFDVWVTSSTMGYGIQILIFSATNCSGTVTQYGPCYNPGVVEPGPVNISAGGLTVGNTYYIMIDGNSGDVCNYIIGANSGISVPVAVNPAAATLCPGETVNLSASGGNGTYTWTATPQLNTTAGANVTATPPGPGTYTYTVNSTTGNPLCPSSTSATATITVNNCGCTVNATNSGDVCPGGTVDLFASNVLNATYSWTGPNGFTSTSQNPTGLIMPTTPGSYTYTVTATVLGVPCTSTTTVTVNALPTVSAGSYSPVCSNVTTVALVGAPSGGTFSGTGVTGTNFNTSAGTQVVTYSYTDANSCSNTATATITVNTQPSVSAGTYTSVCSDAANISLAGTPSGGTFSGTGVTGTNFDPSAGTQTITYSYTDGNGCSNSANTTITINTLPVVSAGTYLDQCANAPFVTLVGSPVGGSFSGAGVTSGQFNPAVGTSSITYNYTDGNSCSNSASTVINVNPVPLVSGGSYPNVCSNAGLVALAGAPAGGTFTGTGVTGSNFDPAAGTQTLSYDYTDGLGCSNSTTTTITVVNPAAINAGTYSPVCIDAANVALVGSPAGGTFSGTGVTSNSFDPSVGTQLITYDYTDPAGCSGSGTTTITVNPLPVVDAGVYAAVCSNGSDIALVGTPSGGTFSGTGVTGTSFDPGSGTQTVIYTYTNSNGCTNADVATITVNAVPVVSAGNYTAVCADASPVSLVGTPVGGTFSGTGVTGNTFNPTSGTQTITYTYTSPQNCTNSSTSTIQVNNLPTINAGTDVTICAGSSVTLNGNGGTSYSWNNGGVNGQAFTPSTGSTVYTVTGTDANGCVNTDNVTVNVFAYPNASANADVTTGNPGLVVNFDNFSTNATLYNWDFGNGASANVSNLNSQTATYGSVGSYLMVLTSSNGICSDTAMIQIDILPYPSPEIHVPNVFTPNGDNANDEFFILTNNASALEVVILNRWGNVVHEINTIDGVWDGDVNGKQADEGVYFFKYVVTGLNNEEITGHGNITLIRK